MTTQVFTGQEAVTEAEKIAREYASERSTVNLAEADRVMSIWHDAVESRSYKNLARLEEAMSRSDFPKLLAAGFDRALLSQFKISDSKIDEFCAKRKVRNFKEMKLLDVLGGQAGLDKVAEAAEYPFRSVSESEYGLSVSKYGAGINLTWEMLIDDELGAFDDLPQRLSNAARVTQAKLGTGLLVDAAGPNTAFFKEDNGNAPDNKPLNYQNLSDAITSRKIKLDVDGNPLDIEGFVLLVPPHLTATAEAIVNAIEVEVTDAGRKLKSTNKIGDKIKVVELPWMGAINKSNKSGTTWAVVPDPKGPRPAFAYGVLTGHEAPEIRYEDAAGSYVGGGPVDVFQGSFKNDTIPFRERFVTGAAHFDPIATYISVGS
ncbi:MAG: Mu-like prophage major head subunit gpT family protein [Candidatus Nanopelagicales bacterium]